jgi:hypothetical protein
MARHAFSLANLKQTRMHFSCRGRCRCLEAVEQQQNKMNSHWRKKAVVYSDSSSLLAKSVPRSQLNFPLSYWRARTLSSWSRLRVHTTSNPMIRTPTSASYLISFSTSIHCSPKESSNFSSDFSRESERCSRRS